MAASQTILECIHIRRELPDGGNGGCRGRLLLDDINFATNADSAGNLYLTAGSAIAQGAGAAITMDGGTASLSARSKRCSTRSRLERS